MFVIGGIIVMITLFAIVAISERILIATRAVIAITLNIMASFLCEAIRAPFATYAFATVFAEFAITAIIIRFRVARIADRTRTILIAIVARFAIFGSNLIARTTKRFVAGKGNPRDYLFRPLPAVSV